MLGHEGFTVAPRRGELIVFDKLARPLVRQILLAVPTKITKGVLIAPTVFGNVMLGPTAEDVERKDDTSSTAAGLAYLRAEGAHHAGAARARGHGRLRGPARCDRACGLPGVDPRRRGLRLCRRNSLDRALGLDGDRRARARAARRGGPAARASRGRVAGAEDAEHRRGFPPPVRGRGGDREGPRVRADRLLLRAGHPRGGPRRPRLAGGARRSRRPAPPHARGMGRCQGFFCGAELAALLAERTR